MGTGEFSSVGSAAAEAEGRREKAEAAKPRADIAHGRRSHAAARRALRAPSAFPAGPRPTSARCWPPASAASFPNFRSSRATTSKAGDLILHAGCREKGSCRQYARAVLVAARSGMRRPRSGWSSAAMRRSCSSTIPVRRWRRPQSRLKAARPNSDANEIKAPFDGVVDRLPVELGSADPGRAAEVATLIALDPLLAVARVSERDLHYLKVGRRGRSHAWSTVTTVEGNATLHQPRCDGRRRAPSAIEIAMPNRGSIALPAGMTAEITLRADPTESVILPRSVVTLSDEGDLGIRAVDKDSKVVFFPIDIVDDSPTGLVLAGIPADARIIVAGQDLVDEGDTVKPLPRMPTRCASSAGEAHRQHQASSAGGRRFPHGYRQASPFATRGSRCRSWSS